jgi:diguanylate cyclase (GGDEF)-like protein
MLSKVNNCLIMNIYSFLPLIATILYIPLIITTAISRPWQTRHKLFLIVLVMAMFWSLTDYIFRGNYLPQYNTFLFQAIIILFVLMAVQFYLFASHFFPHGRRRWLPFGYFSLALVIGLVLSGQIPQGVIVQGDQLYPQYGASVIFLAGPLLVLVGRSVFVLWNRYKMTDSPVIRNQMFSLILGISILTCFTLFALLPWGREIPISHMGNLINALLLSYATVRHELVDIRLVLRRGMAWIIIAIIGVFSYWVIYQLLHYVFAFKVEFIPFVAATIAALATAILLYRLRVFLLATLHKMLAGSSYDHKQRLSTYSMEIHKVFSLEKQGKELLGLVLKALGCSKACLLFEDQYTNHFCVQICQPDVCMKTLASFVLRSDNPIVMYLQREKKPLTRDQIIMLTEFHSMWQDEREMIEAEELEVFLPLISRENLIGILTLDKKQFGKYSLEDFSLLENVTTGVSVSMEKEYLAELMREREKQLAIINRSSAIITSSLDIQRIYDGFITELRKMVDLSWASIVLLQGDEFYFLALSSDINSAWLAGERIPADDTAVHYAITNRKTVVETDLSKSNIRSSIRRYLIEQGICSMVYLPLNIKDKAIGSLIVASHHTDAYGPKNIKLLEELTSLMAMPIANSLLYAEAQQRARSDSLTGLLNRRSLDEMITSEIGRHSRYGGTFSVMLMDLDSFKSYNDTNGHLAGDEFLKRIGNIMKTSIRSADQAFRFGGDEFALVLPHTDGEDARKVGERIINRIAVTGEALDSSIKASIGLASWPVDGIGVSEIINAADSALIQAKRFGGNRIFVYSQGTLLVDDYSDFQGKGEDSRILSTIYSLAATVDSRDHYTQTHSKKVNEYAILLAEALHLDKLEIGRLSTCALLHDIGKIGISDEILNKKGQLADDEWEIIKRHPQIGAAIVSHTRQLASCNNGILYHHERFDGTGYPVGLKGDEIPLEARILAVADAFSAMISKRHYSEPLSREQALKEIKKNAGTQFDPQLTEIFINIMLATANITKSDSNGR